MFLFGNPELSIFNVLLILILWNVIIITGSFTYSVVAVNAGHHGVEIVHEGDEFRSLDYGIYQLGTTIDRIESGKNLFIGMTHFGDHVIHHMFPSLDQSELPSLRETFINTCHEFDWELRRYTLWEAVIEQFKQLGRTEPFKVKDMYFNYGKCNNNEINKESDQKES